jgi:dihydrofolate reductase
VGTVMLDMAMTLDGFAADEDGRSVYPIEDLRDTVALREMIEATGAVVMGRNAYDMANGDFTGYEYQVPIFVLTHRPPDAVAKGQNEHLSIAFVTDGAKAAIQMAQAVSGEKRITVVGGPSTFQQCIAMDLCDELKVRLISRLQGRGLRLFAESNYQHEFPGLNAMCFPGRTDLQFGARSGRQPQEHRRQ